LSWCYRLFILTGILLFVSDEYTVVGMGLAVFLISIWWGIPLLKAVAKTLTEAQPARRHKVLKAWGLWFFLPAILLAVIPMSASVLAPGVVQTETRRSVVTTSSGIIRQLYVSSGQEVQAGELLLTLDNPELLLELKTAEAELLRAEAMLKQARAGGDVDSQPIVAHIKNSTDLVADLKRRINELQITAPVGGTWVDQQIKQKMSGWVRQGTELGYLVDISQPIFLAVVAQEQASLLFQQQPEHSALTIRIAGQAEIDLAVSEYQLIPYSQEYLPSESMSLLAGGGIAVDSQDERGVKAAEPFFLIRAKFASGLNQSSLDGVLPGRSGQLNIELNPEPLLSQWWRGVRQFFQNRYQL
jgi:putative peptide zinc metalloprotease protein